MKTPNEKPHPFPVTPAQLLQNLHALAQREIFLRLKEEGPYLVHEVFADRSQRMWGNFYYGDLRGLGGAGTIRLKVPSSFRLEEGRTYTLSVTPEFSLNGDAPRFVFQVEALHEKGDLAPVQEVRLPKRAEPKRDVQAILMGLLRRGTMPSIALVVGETAIVDQDVEAVLEGAREHYRIDLRRTNLLDPWAVAKALAELGQGPYDLLALVRGGGEGLEALDKPEVWEAVAACPKPVVVALGHAANTLWVETLADQAFPTPTAFGSFLRDVVRAVEREKESAKLADLLHKAQEEARALRQEADQLRERLRGLELGPGALAQEAARLQRALGVWRALALLALALAGLLLLDRLL